MEFLHDGLPRYEREAVWEPPELHEPDREPKADYGADLTAILSMWNVCSKEWVIRQYDHEVQGNTVVKPLIGPREDGPGDAVVMTLSPGERRGIVVSNGLNPGYGDLDPYAMAAAAVDEAVRNAIAVGARLSGIALLDNFSWGNTEHPDRLGALVLASRALYDVAVAYGTPFISGKDSLNNEFKTESGTICIPHTLLVSAICVVPDVTKSVTMDLKARGNGLYLLGTTRDELGGSHYLRLVGERGANVPRVRTGEAVATYAATCAAMADGLIRACHDLSEGGLAVAAAEMAFAGGLGATIELPAVARDADLTADDAILFSESQSRLLCEVAPEHREAFEALIDGLPAARIGEVTATDRVVMTGIGGDFVIDESIDDLREAFISPLRW
jgi:phosphoribosylformylglycinamidine synthase